MILIHFGRCFRPVSGPRDKGSLQSTELRELAVPTEADAKAVVALLECLATPKRQDTFSTFSEWHTAVKDDYLSLFSDVVPNRKATGSKAEETFAQLLEQLHELINKKQHPRQR